MKWYFRVIALSAPIFSLFCGVGFSKEPSQIEKSKDSAVSFAFTEDFELRYWKSDERLSYFPDNPVFNYVEQVNRFTAQANWKRWSAFSQVDQVALFANQYRLDGELYNERELLQSNVWSIWPNNTYLNLEKWMFRYETDQVSFTIGDFYASFGLGGALNINRNVDIDIDTSIQGIHLLIQPDGSLWEVEGLAGQLNRQQVWQDNPNIELAADRRHWVSGLRLTRYALGPIDLSAHGVMYDFVSESGFQGSFLEAGTKPDIWVGGLQATAYSVLGIDWQLEGDLFGIPSQTMMNESEQLELGYGLYGSGSFYTGNLTWLVEAKRYANTEIVNTVVVPELYEVAIFPTLEYERVITEDSAAAVNSNDIYGGRIRTDWTYSESVIPYGSFAIFRDRALGGLHFNEVPETIFHPMVGADVLLNDWTLLLNTGARVDDRDGVEAGQDRMYHGDVDFKFPLWREMHADIALGAQYFHWGNNTFQQNDFFQSASALSLQFPRNWIVTGALDYSNNPLINTTGNLAESLYGSLELQVKPHPAWTIKAFWGAQRAGIRCSGGQCRQVPGFEGGRVAVVGSF
jgi:hypothetical protein